MRKFSIETLQKKAQSKGGKCLSTKYINKETKYKWMCAKGHVWMAVPSFYRGSWCKKCSGKEKKTLEDMKKIAIKRGGKCLSKKYNNIDDKLKWMCVNKHTWLATPSSVQQGTWCPNCNFYLSEALCRTTFEQLFNKKFPKSYPKWLKAPGKLNNLMELDGYNSTLKIAFEYNGEQHYKDHFFNKSSKGNLNKQILHDQEKEKLCKKNNVKLFVITYKDDLTKLSEIIKNKAKKYNLGININFDKEIDFNKVWLHKLNINTMKNLAKEKGGKCLSKKYINSRTKLMWQCSEGHVWMADPTRINRRGHWCAKCEVNKTRLGIFKMREIAEKKGGKCLSNNYTNNRVKLIWKCVKGHIWKTTPQLIMKGHWCPTCGNKLKGRKLN